MPLGTWNTSGLHGNVFGNQFSTFDSPEIILKEFTLAHHKENEDQSHKLQGRGLFTQEMTNKKKRHHSDADVCRKAVDYEFVNTGGFFRSKDSKNRSCNSTNSLIHHHFLVWKIRFKNKATTCSDFPSDAMLWIKEVEMVDSLDEVKSSRSVPGKNFPKFEMLDAKIASALNKIIQNSQVKKKVSLGEQKARKEDQFPRGRQIAFLIYDYFRVTGAKAGLEANKQHDRCACYVWYGWCVWCALAGTDCLRPPLPSGGQHAARPLCVLRVTASVIRLFNVVAEREVLRLGG